jgi:hypothetical protein
MPAMNDGATFAVAGVRKQPTNEPAGDVRGRRPHSAMGIWVKWVRRIAMHSRASNDAPCGKQKQALMVEVAIERGHRRFTLTLVRRI